MRKAFQVIFLLYLAIISVSANSVNYYYDRLSLNEGLSQSTAKVIFRDHIGMLWIGTKEGLNRYDGYEIKTYYHDSKDKKSLPNNNILFILEDSLQNLWIGTDGPLCKYDRQSDSFIQEEINAESISVHNALKVGSLLYLVNENSIFTYNCDNNTWKRSKFKGDETRIRANTKLANWGDGKIIIGSMWSGIFIADPQSGELKRTPFFKNKNILCIHVDSRKRLWISEFGKGVVCFDKSGHKLVDLQENKSAMKLNKVMYILEYKDQILFATDGDGIYFYSPRLNSYTQIISNQDNPFTYPLNSTLTLYSDEYQNLWLGTIRGGAIGVRNVYIKSYGNAALNSSAGLSGLTVLNFHEDESGIIWIGTDGEGINSFNPSNQKFTHFASSFGKKVSSITSFSRQELLLSLYNEGIRIFDKKSGNLRELPLKMEDGTALKLNNLIGTNLANTNDGNIYISDGNVYRYNKTSSKVSLLKNADIDDGYFRLHYRAAHPNQLILYGNSKIWIYNTDTKILQLKYKTNLAIMGVINSLEIDNNGVLWLGTSNGLYHYDDVKLVFKKVISNQFKSISLIVNDNVGSLWIGSGLELFQYRIQTKELYTYQKSDGVNPNEYLPKSKLLTHDGYVYMGGVSGFIRIDKHIPLKAKITPEFEMLNIQLDGALLPAKKIKIKKKSQSIEIPWNFNSLVINIFSNTPDLNTKTRNRFSFAEIQNSYHNINKNEIQIQALTPGKYSLQVQYELKNDTWSDSIQLVTIVVNAPWWQSWWFNLFVFFFILFLLFLIRRNAIRKTRRSMEMQMQHKEREISEQKVKFLINISHELRTPLTLVYSPLRRILIDENISENLKPTLNLMYKHVKNMKNTIDMVLDVRKMEFNSDTLKLKKHRVNDWIKQVIDDFNLELNDKQISIQYDLDQNIQELVFDEEKCVKVLSNLLMNAIKFSDLNSTISIKSTLLENGVRIAVSDQGIGIAQDEVNQLFTRFFQGKHEKGGTGIGLSFSKTLVELHGGSIGYNPNADKGSIFWFELPFTSTNQLSTNILNTLLPNEEDNELESSQPIDYSLLKKLTVLVVEDEIDLLNYMKNSLTPIFNQVITVTNGKKGLEEVYRNTPDLVISDVMMPEMDGFEMCKHIKSDIEISHIPVILLTALGDEDSSLIGYKMGADMYLSKPFAIDLLIAIIGNLFRSRSELKKRYALYNEELNTQDLTFSNADERFLMKLTSLIDKKLDETELRIDDLAVEMAMSRSSFYNKVKVITGLSANVFLNDYKIKKAAILLRDPEIQIQEIAMQLGFGNQRYFSTVFKQITGKTPTQFRSEKEL